ncbi:UbiH/UbiF/VisC/COQ6 family ubiquinone biosynthesis hydroxylase [Bordetella sp. FB-8]|uniref:UbiH/UbiF/VisC/COQ6 family ubiquinone biosynthesis hydroxylase n=1 Tax=Bordetella sp. FB-8 TaxID=1159870 RepID=UPI00036C72BD|nr:UbiH/UbiF/VisC/COQ6 family ubiquinone biosynthesis hydroxylase [Bordetella sp. FB-8]
MPTADFDIAILGAGPVGQVLALLLARLVRDPARIALLAGDGGAAQPAPADDPRIIAINHGSRVLLESLGAWPARSAAIEHIHVSQRGRLGRAVIAREDFGVPALGNTVSYADLHARLLERTAACGVSLMSGPPAAVEGQQADLVQVRQGGTELGCAIAVRCDGAGGQDVQRDYGQHAILTRVSATLARPGWAWERFTREGPLALLPHPQINGDYAVVWCCEPAHASAIAQAGDDEFSKALTATFGTRLGRLRSTAARQVFPLHLKARHAQAQGRLATIGNAAQTLHPVAGQGLNLGLRDAAQLAQALGPWLAGQDGSPVTLLADFARTRLPDRLVTAGITDIMPRAFATGMAPIEHACGLALLALDLSASLRAPLTRHFLQGLRK